MSERTEIVKEKKEMALADLKAALSNVTTALIEANSEVFVEYKNGELLLNDAIVIAANKHQCVREAVKKMFEEWLQYHPYS